MVPQESANHAMYTRKKLVRLWSSLGVTITVLFASVVSTATNSPPAHAALFYREWQMTISPPYGNYFYMLGKYIIPANPYIKLNEFTPANWTADRILAAHCENSQGQPADHCRIGNTNSDDNDPYVEMGLIKRQEGYHDPPNNYSPICAPIFYTYCGSCPAGEATWTYPDMRVNYVNKVQLYWVPDATTGPYTLSSVGTWHFVINGSVVRSVPGMKQATKIWTGGEVTNNDNELGVSHDLLNQYAFRTGPTSYPSWYLWLGPTMSAPPATAVSVRKWGNGNYSLFQSWHVAGAATPTLIPTPPYPWDCPPFITPTPTP